MRLPVRKTANEPRKHSQSWRIATAEEIHFEGRPSFVAKNRYDLPAKMPVPKNFSYGALAPYLPPLPAEIGSKPKPQGD